MAPVIITRQPTGREWHARGGNGRVNASGLRTKSADQAEPSYTDGQGRTWFPYMVEFKSPDGTFAVEVWGMDDAHAERQVAAMRDTAAVQGRIVGTC